MIITDESALRVKCEPVLSGEVDDLRAKLELALEWSAKQGFPGVGLACPQIGIAKCMAIVRVDSSIKIDLVNADVTKGYYPYQFEGEGCLSFPNRYETTTRHKEILVEGNLVWPYRFIATDFIAVVIEHEIDHTKGILLSDRALK